MMDFAAGMLVHTSTGLTFFIADCGYEPRTLFNWQLLKKGIPHAEKVNRQDACNRVEGLQEVWGLIYQNLERTQTNIKKQAD
jgi:hypothetical protein